jgi:addiction module HigA family antidote
MTTDTLPLIHPGEILFEEFMQPLGLSQNRLERDLGVPAQRVGDIIHGKRAITTDTALRLAVYFRISPEFWLNLQKSYDLRKARAEGLADRIARDVRPLPVSA